MKKTLSSHLIKATISRQRSLLEGVQKRKEGKKTLLDAVFASSAAARNKAFWGSPHEEMFGIVSVGPNNNVIYCWGCRAIGFSLSNVHLNSPKVPQTVCQQRSCELLISEIKTITNWPVFGGIIPPRSRTQPRLLWKQMRSFRVSATGPVGPAQVSETLVHQRGSSTSFKIGWDSLQIQVCLFYGVNRLPLQTNSSTSLSGKQSGPDYEEH